MSGNPGPSKSSRKGGRWLTSCGVGCVLLAIVVIAIVGGGYFFFKRTFEEVIQAAESHDALVAAHGEVADYAPPADGSVPPERMELFCGIRESLGEPRAAVQAAFAEFPPDDAVRGKQGARAALKVLGSLAGLIGPIGEYVDRRNELLLGSEMGLGEYVYIYATAYYSWLGHSPDERPVLTKPGAEGDELFEDDEGTFSAPQLRRRYRRYALAFLRNQADSATPGDAAGWGDLLAREIRRVESHPARVAWEDGLPETIETSLDPFRARLEATYDRTTNCFELPRSAGERRGAGFTIRMGD